jgi:hypothetical protein
MIDEGGEAASKDIFLRKNISEQEKKEVFLALPSWRQEFERIKAEVRAEENKPIYLRVSE